MHDCPGACIFGPLRRVSLRQAAAFLLPGALLVALALPDFGFWAGGWLLGLPAWGRLLSRWTRTNPLRVLQLLKFLGLLVLGLLIFTFNPIYSVPSLGLQAAVEVLLGVAAVVVAFAFPAPQGS